MMTMIADIVLPLAQAAAQQGAEAAQSGWFSHVGFDGMGAGGAAAGLAGVWFFFKVIRKVVATLFMFCISYLVCKCCFGVDISGLVTPFLHLLDK